MATMRRSNEIGLTQRLTRANFGRLLSCTGVNVARHQSLHEQLGRLQLKITYLQHFPQEFHCRLSVHSFPSHQQCPLFHDFHLLHIAGSMPMPSKGAQILRKFIFCKVTTDKKAMHSCIAFLCENSHYAIRRFLLPVMNPLRHKIMHYRIANAIMH